jgi:ATP-dependent RNA helicase DeaD
MLELEEYEAALIFRRTKNGAAELAERLIGRGFSAVAMHGDMNQRERENVIRRLKAGQVEVVVATDVAARGLDVEQITHVINYDMPHDVEVYVHRIGRTGRAGRSGVATLFVTPRERRMKRDIEQFTGSVIKAMKMPSQADVAARRVAQLKETIRKNIAEGDLDLYVQLVEQLAEEGPHDLAEIAAAAARLAGASKPVAVVEEPVSARPARASFAPSPSTATGGDKVRLSMAVGKKDGIRPGDVVGSIANEANIAGRDIGPIDIRDSVTYVTIPAEYADMVIEKVGRAKFRGRPLDLKIAGPGGEESESGRETRRPAFQPRRQEWRPSAGGRPGASAGRGPSNDRRPPRKPFNDRGPRKGPPTRKGR